MGTQLVLNDNWEVFSLTEEQKYFESFIDYVKRIDESTPDIWVKWKNSCSQVVIETPKYFYKIYQNTGAFSDFNTLIREKLGEIYRNEYGLYWNIITVRKENVIYQIEQREKLKVCMESDISYDDLMIKWGIILNKLEKQLSLPLVARQLKDKIKKLDKIKLIRDCVNKYEDYAITNNKDIILLDDADFFLAMVDNEGNWISSKFNSYEIITPQGYKKFVPCDYYEILENETELLNLINMDENKWMISKEMYGEKDLKEFVNKSEEIVSDNIKVLYTGNKLENKKLEYIPPSMDSYPLFMRENKLLIEEEV